MRPGCRAPALRGLIPCKRYGRWDTAAGLGAILLWSMTVAVARSLAEQLGPVTAATAVYTVGSLPVLFMLRRRSGIRPAWPWRYLFVCGALFVGYMLLFYLAIGGARTRQQVLEVGLINYLWPVLTLLFSLPLLGNKAGWLLWPGTLVALTGIVLVVTQGADVSWIAFRDNIAGSPGAYAAALAAAVSWALYSNLTRRWAGGRAQGAIAVFMPATALFLLILCGFADEPRVWSLRSAFEAVFLGITAYIAYRLWDHAMRHGDVVKVAAASYLTPLLSTLAGCMYLAVWPGVRLWLGCVVLVAGSLMSWRAVEQK